MQTHADQDLWQREQAFLAQEKMRVPERFVPTTKAPDELNTRIGILSFPKDLPKGYIKFSPLDFIVEEIRQDGRVITVDGDGGLPLMEGTGTIYADIVKVGISTLDAATRIASALGIEAKQIGHAEIKDAVALTSQTVSLRGTTLDAVRALTLPNMLITNVVEGKGAIGVGNLKGNRFTLFIRTETELVNDVLSVRVHNLNVKGAMNYYGPQRFGSPRFISHILGLYLMRGEPEETVKTYFTKTSPFELPYFTELRERVAAVYGDWARIRELISPLPYSCRYELLMLAELEKGGEDAYVRAIGAVSQQADLWVRAYASYLTNLILSDAAVDKRNVPDTIPLLLNADPSAHQFYEPWLTQHGTREFPQNLFKFKFTNFINLRTTPSIPARIRPVLHGHKITPEGVAISFDLPKGAYATTILMYLFDTVTGMPIPSWLKQTEVDSKQLLGTGSIAGIAAKLSPSIRQMMEKKQGEEGAEPQQA